VYLIDFNREKRADHSWKEKQVIFDSTHPSCPLLLWKLQKRITLGGDLRCFNEAINNNGARTPAAMPNYRSFYSLVYYPF
jgi:hypothetical protein